MFKYSEFITDKVLKSVNESIIYYSPDLKRKLNRLKNDSVAAALVGIEGENIKPDVTFVDLDKDGYFSFITMKNAMKMISSKYSSLARFANDKNIYSANLLWDADKEEDGENTGITKKSRNPVRMGRLINQIFPEKFTSKQIEDFVNKLKSLSEKKGEVFEIVEGDDIEFWYNSENYAKLSGSLGSSCMRSAKNIFQIYTMNPESCRMLVLLENDTLKARALIWKVNIMSNEKGNQTIAEEQPFEYFLDRQYTINDSDVNKMRNYATEQGWAYKAYNNHSSLNRVNYKDKEDFVYMTVNLKKINYPSYPYMDTFRIYDPSTGILENTDDERDKENKGKYFLASVDGGYDIIQDGVWSEYYAATIPDNRAVWSDPFEDYLDREQSVQILCGNRRFRGWWPEDSDDICWDERNERYIHSHDAVYSDYYMSYILLDDSVNVVTRIDSDGNCNSSDVFIESDDVDYVSYSNVEGCIWFDVLSSRHSYWDNHTGILNDLLVMNYAGKFIPEKFMIFVYKIDDIYLSSIDAFLLGKKVNQYPQKSQCVVMDKFEYNDIIKSLYPELTKSAQSIINKNQLELGLEEPNKEAIEKRNKEIEIRLYELEDETFF